MLAPLLALAAAALAATDERPADPEGATPPREEVKVESEARPRKDSWFLLPAVFWLPETKAGIAVAAGRDFRLAGAPRASNALFVGAYAIGGQWEVDASTEAWLRGGTLVSGRARAVYYPDAFYGVGPTTSVSSSEDFLRRFLELTLGAEVPAVGALRVGLRLTGRVEDISEVVPGGLLATSGLSGLDGFNAIGAGGSVTWDTRDHPLRPQRGTFAQAAYVRYPDGLGTTDGFGKGTLDLREFVPLGSGRVLALAGVVETTDGDTPFSVAPKLGNPRFFRGYREGRFRDEIAWATQAELRVPVPRVPRLAGTLFAAAGDVAPDVAAITLEHLKVAGGLGARWRLTDEGVSLRLDVAVGTEGFAVYLLLLEAF